MAREVIYTVYLPKRHGFVLLQYEGKEMGLVHRTACAAVHEDYPFLVLGIDEALRCGEAMVLPAWDVTQVRLEPPEVRAGGPVQEGRP